MPFGQYVNVLSEMVGISESFNECPSSSSLHANLEDPSDPSKSPESEGPLHPPHPPAVRGTTPAVVVRASGLRETRHRRCGSRWRSSGSMLKVPVSGGISGDETWGEATW